MTVLLDRGKKLNVVIKEEWIPFANELVARRTALARMRGERITQGDVAKGTGISEKQIGRLERAESGTEEESVVALADYLEYTGEERAHFFAMAGMIEKKKKRPMPSNLTPLPDWAGTPKVIDGVSDNIADTESEYEDKLSDEEWQTIESALKIVSRLNKRRMNPLMTSP